MQVSFGDGRTEDIREGARITLKGRDSNSPPAMFHLAVASSWNLKGRPVLVNGFLPGVSMLVEAPSPRVSGGLAEALLSQMWQEVWPHFSR
jgi:hypothetical protein